MPDLDIDKFIQILHAAGDSLRNPPAPSAAPVAKKAEAPSTYGPHLLSDEQAAAFQLMMNIMGHNGDTVGRGGITEVDLGPHNQPIVGKDGKTHGWTLPNGDYFNGQGPDGTQGHNPDATPIAPHQGIAYEQTGNGPSPAPYGYTPDGRPRAYPGQGDSDNKSGISEYAPNRIQGPALNPYKGPTASTGKDATNNGRVKAE